MDPTAPIAPRRHRLQGWLVLGVLTAAILATFSLLAWRDLRTRDELAARQGHDTSWFIGRSVSERFRHYDRVLGELVTAIEAAGPEAVQSDPIWEGMLSATRTIPHVRSMGIYDAHGRVIQHTEQRGGIPGINVADRPYFRDVQEMSGRQTAITIPIKSRVYGDIVIGLARAIRDKDGRFAGAALIALSPEAFDLLGGLPNLPRGSAIAIHRRDGINLFRAPLLPDQLGRDLSKTPLFTESLPGASVGVTYTPMNGSIVDGNDRLLAYRALDDWPLVVVVGILRAEIIGGWRRDWMRNAVLVGIALVGFSWLATIVQRQITSRLEAELALSRKELEHRLTVENELRRWASTDVLTGMANRRHFIDVAEREMPRAQRYGRPMAVLVFDVDHFKSVNDRYGHATGDEALKAIARSALQTLRETDLLGRLGGEEFGVLLPETDLAGAAELAERLRAGIAVTRVTAVDGDDVTLSVSIGCADVGPTDESIDCVLARADVALYRAKNTGRNRVEVSGPPCQPQMIKA
jgi:diguanylate cyclase (GGDEF)-like protein